MKNSQTFTRNWFSKHGIMARIVILFLLLVIIPFFMMAGFVVMVFRDYNVTSLGNSAMDSMSSVGYQISRELKTRKESSMFAYYNDIVAMLDEGQITEQERQFIEKRLTSSVYSTEGVAAGAIIGKDGEVYGVGSYSRALSFMKEHEDEVLNAGGRCCWYATNKVYGSADKNKYILARSLNNEDME